ncbi:MAG: HAD family hydrolase, partial [Rectinemataceae bacterium]|nr:HAD family hydrolase [Rectinemataceae bacterium]
DRDFSVSLMDYIRSRHLPDFDTVNGLSEFRRFMVLAFDGSIAKPDALRLFLDSAGIMDPEVRADLIRKELEYSQRICLFPTEKETLLELAQRGFALGMITNSFQSAAEKASWFGALGLGCIAQTVVSSIDAGVSKPDPGIYLEFARRIGSTPGEIAFVGHEAFELAGARAAGMIPVSFNCSPEIRENLHLGVFSDLLAMFPAPGSTP